MLRATLLLVIDTHCHLTFPEFSGGEESVPGGVAGVLERSAAHGVTGCITISTTTRDCVRSLDVARRFERVWCTAGVHPSYSEDGPHEWEVMGRCGADPKCVAWGELGLDNHHKDPSLSVQREVLDQQLDFLRGQKAAGVEKPLVLHCREAFTDLVPVLKQSGLDPTRMVFHCFTGAASDMRALLDLGCWVSFTGVVTYKNAGNLREALQLPPLDRIMVETDAPFLSPEPHRAARPCEPWMVSVTARRLSELRGVAFGTFCDVLDDNTFRFFGVR